ncbi:TrbI/VirB10 family protein [Magnetospirillum sp. 15-1]|uniref:TrbI/VirB10 family protein n=1 Tax=Magnetospirillum sp. 15-1 TaxID=1979370 RepID=UPI000BBB8776|nr:TrbI/VirB10 family protein [Magnetospirillum sp. 15-1]
MTGKSDPDSLVLKAPPRRPIRFKRGLLIGIAAVGSAAILTVVGLALRGPGLRLGQPVEELYSTGRKATPDGLAGLPGSYGQIKPAPPQLGPPLPGDLGRPILERQRQLGLAPLTDHAAEAERQRLASQALKAREAGVFFPIVARPPAATAVAMGPGSAAPETPRLALDPERDPNGQQRKLDFVNQKPETGITNPHALQIPVSPWQVMAGSVIAASLITGLNSDLPGLVVAQITENVYDSVTGKILLIPQGARLIGGYDSVVAFGQSRALVVWRRIVMPDGTSIQVDNLPASDAAGLAGLEDGVDYHTGALLKGVVLSTLLGIGTELSLGSGESGLLRAIRQSTQQSVNQAGQRLTEKTLAIQPTLTIRPGWPLRVIVHQDLILRPYRG